MFQRYANPIALLEQMPWSQIPRFISNLIKETQEEEIERTWYAKDIDMDLEEFRKKRWKQQRRAQGKPSSKVDRAKKEKVKAMEKRVGLKEKSIEDLEL